MSESTRCWHCNGTLIQFRKLHFAELNVRDENGELTRTVRVHKCCLKSAQATQANQSWSNPYAEREYEDT